MAWHAGGLRRLDRIIWAVVAVVAAAVLLAAASGFRLVLTSFAAPGGTVLALLIVARYYGNRRADPYLASALESTAQVIAFAAVAAPLSYVAAAAALPLQDAAFDTLDRAMRFDWNALFGLFERFPGLHRFFRVAYLSLTVQMTAVVLLLGFTGKLAWLRVYTLAFIIAALITIAVSAVLPAQGVWLQYGLTSADPALLPVSHSSWPVFLGLRDGSHRLLMAAGAEGIITFPSLHAALAVILIVALWPVPVARWVGGAINVLMLAATPVDGSHYLIDILAGIVIAAVSLYAARALVARLAASKARDDGAAALPGRVGLTAASR